ncbi:unnamed protein product [Ophioblennius macclurei]
MKHVSVGPAGIWGVDGSDNIYKYVSGDFIQLTGQNMIQLDAGGNGYVVGVIDFDSTHCLRRGVASRFSQAGSLSWKDMERALRYISCSSHGCWAVTRTQQLVFTKIIPDSCAAFEWTSVTDTASVTIVETGTDGSVFTVNEEGQLYERTGISSAAPLGTGWTLVPVGSKMKHMSYDQGVLWGINDVGTILKCTK